MMARESELLYFSKAALYVAAGAATLSPGTPTLRL